MKNTKTAIITTTNGKERLSTQEVLEQIYAKIDEGYNNFEIDACGQHNLGGSLWLKNNETLKLKIKNPGQRVGSMGMAGTEIIVEGAAPADVGWLNAGADIVVKGDSGDTTAHCAATGTISIGGRVGTRSGALMKYDPKFSAPEFWVLKNTGSFSFEFMSGGIAVICGYNCENLKSVLGNRSCVGMVGGTIYVRGNISDISDEVVLTNIDETDEAFLLKGLDKFLNKIERPELIHDLTDFSNWKKIIPKTFEERKNKSFKPIQEFRTQDWVKDGIFGDLIEDDYYVSSFGEANSARLRTPVWKQAHYSAPCEYNCPISIPTQKRIELLRQGNIEEALRLVLDYSPFPASVCGQVCPNLCLDECNRKHIDIPVKIAELGALSKNIKIKPPKVELKEKVAIIGSGVAGLTSAWHLKKMGYSVEIFEQDSVIGGKLKQVIPEDRLAQDVLNTELKRIKDFGIKVHLNKSVDKNLFNELKTKFDAIVVAIGAHNPIILPIEGNEKLVKGLDFLKQINKNQKPKVGKKVVVIGAGNAAMDVIIGAYQMGAEEVTAIDIQKPAAFDKEIQHVEKLGAKILWPCYTDKITEQGVLLKNGKLLEADTVIVAVGDRPVLSFLEPSYATERGFAKVNEFYQSSVDENTFIAGDAAKQGLFTHAIADGRKIALNIHKKFNNLDLDSFENAPMIPQDRVKSEYYPSLTQQGVLQMDAKSETERCLSCGNCRDCEFCLNICPERAISRVQIDEKTFEYTSDEKKCIGCGICAGVCPCGIWEMKENIIEMNEA